MVEVHNGNSLPEDVVIEILALLPVKTLMRFRCVRKSWCTLIEDPSFISKHLVLSTRKRNNQNCKNSFILMGYGQDYGDQDCADQDYDDHAVHHAICIISDETLEIYENNLQQQNETLQSGPLHMCGCVNGIVCFTKTIYDMEDRAQETDTFLWNPATRQLNILPKSIKPEQFHAYTALGYDSKTNDYKIVRFITDSERRTDVYILNTNSWKSVDDAAIPWSISISSNRYGTTYVNGIFSKTGCSTINENECLVSFNMSDESLLITPMPDLFDPEEDPVYSSGRALCELNDSVALIKVYDGCPYDKSGFIIWVLNGYGFQGCWKKIYTIDYPCSGPYLPLIFRNNGELFVESYEDDMSLALCDLITHEVRKLNFLGQPTIFVYKESLVSVHQGKICVAANNIE